MIKNLIFIISTIFASLSLFSQDSTNLDGKILLHLSGSNSSIITLPLQKETPRGSVYLQDKWLFGSVELRDSSIISGYKTNLNLFTKQIEFQINDKTAFINSAKVNKFSLLDEKSNVENYVGCSNIIIDYPDLGTCDFVQILFEGRKAKLIDKLTLDLIPSNYNVALGAGNNYDTYTLKHNFYIIKDGQLLTIRKSKSSVLLALNDKKNELKLYINQNNLNLSNVEDLTKVVKFYNSLYEQNTH